MDIKTDGLPKAGGGTALVIKSTGSWYILRDDATGEYLDSRITGKLRLRGSRSTNPVVVGDRVEYLTDDSGTGVIQSVGERRNYIIRRSSNLSKESHVLAANVDQAFLVVTLTHPVTNREFIDRFLVTAEAYRIPAVLILNKTDLYTTPALAEERADFLHTYAQAGYEVIEVEAQTGANVEVVKARLRDRISLLAGNSGVGKSTLIRAIDPSLDIRIGKVSDSHHKGMHTTTFSEMFPIEGGGYIIDTPGVKGFGLIGIAPEEASRYFPDLFKFSAECQYYNCTHTHEPNCAVKEAVERGGIGWTRYESYLKLLDGDDKYR